MVEGTAASCCGFHTCTGPFEARDRAVIWCRSPRVVVTTTGPG
jgi:hypothetical protein